MHSFGPVPDLSVSSILTLFRRDAVVVLSGGSRGNKQMTVPIGPVGVRHGEREDSCQYGADHNHHPRFDHG